MSLFRGIDTQERGWIKAGIITIIIAAIFFDPIKDILNGLLPVDNTQKLIIGGIVLFLVFKYFKIRR